MASEAEIIIAFLFKRSGKNELRKSEIYLPLSLDLGWFSTKESQDFVNYAIKKKLLTKKREFLVPSFGIENISIPVGFFPSKKIFTEEKKETGERKSDVTNALIHLIAEKTNQDAKAVVKEIKDVESEKSVLFDVAALLIAKTYEIDTTDHLEAVEDKIFTKNEE
jgi:hypothetical protein